MKQTVEIPYDLSVYIERLFFEYNSSCKLIAYLMRQDDINEEYLEKYIKENERKFTELEIAKNKVGKEYRPNGFENFNYEFDFDNHSIIYEEINEQS